MMSFFTEDTIVFQSEVICKDKPSDIILGVHIKSRPETKKSKSDPII